ncbi:MAG: flagellar basal body rod C-terminal domain-containing protein [Kiloniellales bacterium]|nr:flagellar basal body rod C-terminal domain-containing protein [Kiloniellales bacterium]
MTEILQVALSALRAEEKRLQTSAHNVANLRSEGLREGAEEGGGFQAQVVRQSSLPGGGVVANLAPRNPASVLIYDPSSGDADARGFVARPNVNLAEEFVTQITARRAYEASLKLIAEEDKRLRYLNDILT